jgi:diamine N-acetyltransferase
MIRLRKIEPTDIPYLYQWENDARMWADSDTHNPLSQADLREYVASSTGDIYRDGQLRLMIDEDGSTMGCIDLFDFDPRNRKAAIGMYIAPHARGRGIGTKAVKLIEEYAFGFLKLRMLYAFIATKNTACSTIYKKEGYEPSSILKAWTIEDNAILWQKIHE